MNHKLSVIFIFIAITLLTGCMQQKLMLDAEPQQTTEEVNGNIAPEKQPQEQAKTVEEPSESTVKEIEESKPSYRLQENWTLKPIGAEGNEKVVLLTIDDAPDKHALEMAKTMKELNAEAIFFVNGHFLDTEEEKQILKQIYDLGFEVGNHTYNHKSLPEIDQATQKEEIIKLNDLVEEITGERPHFFRAPHGMNTDYSRQLVKDEGMLLMNWSYGYDWNQEYMSKEAIADIMVNTELLGNGSNLLMHDREWTSAALADIVTGLRDKGYEILNPELIQIPNGQL